MDPALLSRLQFAVATYFHFLFVPLTLGLSLAIAVLETAYVTGGDERYKTLTLFWGKIFLINFAVGVVTGITLEFQFGTNWSRYSRTVGNIFGPLLAIEATVAFFLESTFIAVWAFGWKRLSPKAHAVAIWLVALAANVSAIWILIANSWMQHPVGYIMKDGRPVLNDLLAVVTQKVAILTILHTLASAYVVTGFFLMGISAYLLLQKRRTDLFVRSFRTGMVMAVVFIIFVVVEGHMHAGDLAEKQPAKLASLEAHWDTRDHAPVFLFALPRLSGEGNLIEIGPIPSALSMLTFHRPDARVTGLRDIPAEDRPPVAITYLSFRFMVTFGGLLLLLALAALVRQHRLESSPTLLRVLFYAIPLPYLVTLAGWTVSEVGRQPWIVYGLMRTSDGVSPVSTSQVALSLAAFLVVYGLIGLGAFGLMARTIKKGPEGLTADSGYGA